MSISRRNFIWTSAGAAGVGLVLGSSAKPLYADEEADLELSGTGADLNTGNSAPYGFHAEMRFMQGKFVAADGKTPRGTFAFI